MTRDQIIETLKQDEADLRAQAVARRAVWLRRAG